MSRIFEAASATDYREFATLIREYASWLLERLATEAWFMEGVFKAQSLDSELENLKSIYAPPNGKLLFIEEDGKIAGGVAYRELSDGICEMKRMYVRDKFRGKGLGRKLSGAIITAARQDSYHLMRLDTARRLTEAIALYRSVGFTECQPYRTYPEELRPHLLFMELKLSETYCLLTV